jgi:hypothetical protein
MYILWIIYFVAIIITFAGLFNKSIMLLFSGGVILLSATLISFFIVLRRYRDYSYKEEKRINMFLMMNGGKGLEDIKKGPRSRVNE